MLALIGVVLGGAFILSGRVDLGMQLGYDRQHVVITSVSSYSPARREGFQAGMVVINLNGTLLVDLPQDQGPDPSSPDGPSIIQPLVPTVVPLDPGTRNELLDAPIWDIAATTPAALETWSPSNWTLTYLPYSYVDPVPSQFAWALTAFILCLGTWWLVRGRGGRALQPIALPLSLAVAAPFMVRPLEASWFAWAIVIGRVLLPVAMLPLGDALARRVENDVHRNLVRAATVAFTVGAAVIGVVAMWTDPWQDAATWIRLALVAAIPLVPGLAAAGPILRLGPGGIRGAVGSSGSLLRSAEFAVAGATPTVALVSRTDLQAPLVPLALWLGLIALASRFTIRPLARLVTRAQLQRDLVVAATEAERARVAADIHDDALQDLTLLVRRLDESGDTESAAIARTVSDRLRAICGDLRLPILDDLGVGPALDWLVLRIERLAGGEVRLERTDGTRPPPAVELAIFRVAQEALGNAVKHGRPPIVVRYRATDSGASLAIDDAGPGITVDAGDLAEKEGHFGLLNMQQRAEQIGAILDIRPWPGGGTHVALEWRPR